MDFEYVPEVVPLLGCDAEEGNGSPPNYPVPMARDAWC